MNLHSIKTLIVFLVRNKVTLFLMMSAFLRTTISHGSNSNQSKFLIDQLGYRPNDFKITFIKNENPGPFQIKQVNTNKIIFEGKADKIGMIDLATSDTVFDINFTKLVQPGEYYIFLPNLSAVSHPFKIGNDVYNNLAVNALQSFYYQRCGIEINNGTIWKHPACHTENAVFFDNPALQKNVTGGWHDAGDYNKFVPTTAVSIAFMLYAYEYNPSFFTDHQLNIPESNNSIPDILDEAKWGLNWLLKMQRNDGAVYHKVSIKVWTGEHLPNEETDQQFIFGISSQSTADAAAVFALGARIFEKFNKQYSMKLLQSSISAWKFLALHPYNIPEGGFKNPDGVVGGEYNDPNDLDERLWAAIELYRVTGSDKYIKYFALNYKKVGGPNETISWQNTANFALYSFLNITPSTLTTDIRENILTNLKTYANNLLTKVESSGYRCALSPDEYYWGSNSIDLGYAFDLINAYQFTNQIKYLNCALDQLHYLLGRNTFGISFVTGVGYNSVIYPYHQFSMLLTPGNPVPGMVVGGPNKFSRLNGNIISNFPGACYEDNEKNYYVNEPAINYTAPLVFVASFLADSKASNEAQ